MAKRALGFEDVAAEVGRLFGTTEKHARHWLNQRQALVEALGTIRDRANALMTELGGNSLGTGRRRRRAKEGVPVVQPGMRESRKRRVLSAQTRAKMRAAAKARWAEIRKNSAKITDKK
jgi:hypothetical protein